MKNKILAVLGALGVALGVLVGIPVSGEPTAVAQANTSAKVNIGNDCRSQRAIAVFWENSFTGVRYEDLVPVCRSEGEGTGNGNGTSEPIGYRTDAGWCSQYQHVIAGYTYPWSRVIGGGDAGGWWTDTRTFASVNTEHHTRVHHWNC